MGEALIVRIARLRLKRPYADGCRSMRWGAASSALAARSFLFCRGSVISFVLLLLVATPCLAQPGQREPNIGYAFPSGGQVGTEVTVEVGGQYLESTSAVHISGRGVQATVLKHKRPLTPREYNLLRNQLDEARKELEASRSSSKQETKRPSRVEIAKMALRRGVTKEELEAVEEYRQRRADEKRQLNPQLAETVLLKIMLDADAPLGKRELRLKTDAGLSNSVYFMVGQWPEHREVEPNDRHPQEVVEGPFPAVLNGQIMPGDVDRFLFAARRGQRLVVAVRARELVPYLADAVPGWFQATVGLYDSEGSEVAYVDDFRFHPDPLLYYEIPRDGMYGLEIKDAIYRGREDFVYRVTLGEVPVVTSIFPLGGRVGQVVDVELRGWNLPVDRLEWEVQDEGQEFQYISVEDGPYQSNRVPFAVDTLDEVPEQEKNDDLESAQLVKPPLIINGRIDQPGDRDLYRFVGRARGTVAVEVQARRLGSPVDSLVEIIDSTGKRLAANDDHEDRGAGLITHHADSKLEFKLPADGDYIVRMSDAQDHGGVAYGYRLRISSRQRDFDLRVVPSSVNVRPRATVPLTVYALRREGFREEITLELKDPPAGFKLSGGVIPADQDEISVTISVPGTPNAKPQQLELEGFATSDGQEIRRPVVPADDLMQAFIYRHLVPAEALLVSVSENARRHQAGRSRAGGRVANALADLAGKSVQIPAGGVKRFRIPFPKSPNLDQIKLALKDPPEGIEIKRVQAGREWISVSFSADAAKVAAGQQGNLILEAFVERTLTRQDGSQVTRRVPVATLPAIGYKIEG